MNNLESKTLTSLVNNKLNVNKLGERKWYKYYIRVTELVWSRNNHDGYQIEVYSDNTKREHLITVKI